MVVVIMMLAAGMAVPLFIRSYKGAKLRTSARTVVMSHRYARGMAVLKQTQVAAIFDKLKNEIEIVSVASSAAFDDRSKFVDQRADRTGVESVDQKAGGPGEAPEAPSGVSSELVRPLAEGVKIAAFESDRVEQERDGIYWVNYYANGMCDPYSIRLEDEQRRTATITVDPLSGKAKVEYE